MRVKVSGVVADNNIVVDTVDVVFFVEDNRVLRLVGDRIDDYPIEVQTGNIPTMVTIRVYTHEGVYVDEAVRIAKRVEEEVERAKAEFRRFAMLKKLYEEVFENVESGRN